MIWNCPVCGKAFDVLWPHLWAYKRNSKYICSWKCLRAEDAKHPEQSKERSVFGKMKTIVTRDQKQKAVQIALEGGNPLRWLEDCGSANPPGMWYTIKTELKQTDPETYEKLPKRIQRKDSAPPVSLADAMSGMQNAADMFFGACEDAGLRLNAETPETPKAEIPKKQETCQPAEEQAEMDDLETTAVRDKNLGEFYFDHDYNCIDWRNGLGDEISLGISGWKTMVEKLPTILKKLGVVL